MRLLLLLSGMFGKGPFCALFCWLAYNSSVEIEEAARLETPRIVRQSTSLLDSRDNGDFDFENADTLKLFDMVFTMTRGGPGSATEFVSLMIQRIGFRAFDQGLASAQALILLVVTIVLSQLYIRYFYKEVQQ